MSRFFFHPLLIHTICNKKGQKNLGSFTICFILLEFGRGKRAVTSHHFVYESSSCKISSFGKVYKFSIE